MMTSYNGADTRLDVILWKAHREIGYILFVFSETLPETSNSDEGTNRQWENKYQNIFYFTLLRGSV